MTETATINVDHLTEAEPFSTMDRDAVRAILDNSEVRPLHAGEVIFGAGEPYKNAVFIVYDGRVERQRANGETETVGRGAILGLANYLDNATYTSTTQAVRDCTLLILGADMLKRLETRHRTLFDALNRIIAERIRSRSISTQATSGALVRPVRSAMKSPLSTCGPEVTLKQAFHAMQERKIGSLGVLGDNGGLLGILTCSGISEALALKDASPASSILQAACDTPRTIVPGAPLWQAEDMLQRYGVKYLVVMENHRPAGMISQTDILRALITSQSNVADRAMEARSITALQRLYTNIAKVAREARESNRTASRAVRVVSDAHLAIQRRCVELTLEQMAAEGYGVAPRPYALLVMGSGGRREMLLTPDQDNGIILADGADPPTDGERDWFTRFAEHLNANLDRIGYILCPGDIMARNPMFHKTLTQWKQQISHLARHPNQKAARWSNIVFDFDTLYGDDALTQALRDHLLGELKQHQALLEFMVEDDAEGRPPLGLFNRLITADEGRQKGKIDIKRNGLRIIGDAARIYALSTGIGSCNTLERLQTLVRQGILSADLVDSASVAYEELLDLLLAHQIAQQEAGEPIDKLIAPDGLSHRERDTLRVSMRAIKRFQDQLQGRFGRSAF